MVNKNSFGAASVLRAGERSFRIYSLRALDQAGFSNVARLPYSLKVLLENLLRHEDGRTVTAEQIEKLANWSGRVEPAEISFMPARVLLQDFTGVPCVVDFAAMRDALKQMGCDPRRANPLIPADLVIDHSVQVDYYGSPDAFRLNTQREYERNRERYAFLRWGQSAFSNLRVVPPGTGIIHQVNLEYLAHVVFTAQRDGESWAYPDTLLGTDSHTTMINSLGVLGWGVGGIEAEACMLGQPIPMLIPEVVGFKLYGTLPPGATPTDVVLTVTQMLRKKGVVGKFVEFYGPGLSALEAADRAVIANMAPEYGATMGFFPIDAATLEYLRLTGRPPELIELVEAYAREQGLFRTEDAPEPIFTDTLELDLGSVVPSLAGPRRPQDRVALGEVKKNFLDGLGAAPREVAIRMNGEPATLRDGSVVIAAITSCTNTSNPTVMLGAGLLARKAVERGLRVKPWVKTSLSPGSKVVMDYLRDAGVLPPLEALGFHLTGFGCMTCIGNSGPLPDPVTEAVQRDKLVVAAVLSGNRNFEGRVHPLVRANYLASPPLVVAYALAGRVDIDLTSEALGEDREGRPVYLRDLWPAPEEVREAVARSVRTDLFLKEYSEVFRGDEQWAALESPTGDLYQWDPGSTYIKRPPYFDEMVDPAEWLADIRGMRALVVLGDSITTDHISPAGSIHPNSPAGQYLISLGVEPRDFNSYGARRGNHEVMIRGTLASVRLRNLLVPGVEGWWTIHLPDGEKMTIYDAAMRYRQEGVPLLILAGKEYGSGSSRDWAAKGVRLLGVRAVIAESFERIHRSNLVGMGVLPLEFQPGENRETLGLTGTEAFAIEGVAEALAGSRRARVRAVAADGSEKTFEVKVRVDTPQEAEYYRNGGILPYMLRQLAAQAVPAAADPSA